MWFFIFMININEIIGKKIGRLTPIKEVESSILPSGQIRRKFLCKCDCGNEKEVLLSSLRSGNTISCGCYNIEQIKKRGTLHGETNKTPEYGSWSNMKARCCNKSHSAYKDYGGRGISVCERWLESYENFLADMGRKPTPNHSIDRKDNDGNYESSNCRWATKKEQAINRRSTIYLSYNNEVKGIKEMAEILNMTPKLLRKRLRKYEGNLDKAFNPKKSKLYLHNGVEKTLGEISKVEGIGIELLWHRIHTYKKTLGQAVEMGVGNKNITKIK